MTFKKIVDKEGYDEQPPDPEGLRRSLDRANAFARAEGRKAFYQDDETGEVKERKFESWGMVQKDRRRCVCGGFLEPEKARCAVCQEDDAVADAIDRRSKPIEAGANPSEKKPRGRFCGECGEAVSPKAKFCESCGKKQPKRKV